MKNVQTFRASCAAGDKTGATAWLIATETLKGPDEAAYDAFVHVMKGLLHRSPVVIKLQDVGHLSEREARIAALLTRHAPPNVIVPICEFKCKNDLIEWKRPLTSAKQFCSGNTDTTSVFVMEYIPHNLIEFLSTTSVTASVYRSILKQLGFALANLHVGLKITHGDIGSGNLMIKITEPPRTIHYTINGEVYSVDTLGYEPILIDFQRSYRYSGQTDYGILADEIAMTFDVIVRWAKDPPFSLTGVLEELGMTTRVSDILRLLTNM